MKCLQFHSRLDEWKDALIVPSRVERPEFSKSLVSRVVFYWRFKLNVDDLCAVSELIEECSSSYNSRLAISSRICLVTIFYENHLS